jgi:hypothetical protein
MDERNSAREKWRTSERARAELCAVLMLSQAGSQVAASTQGETFPALAHARPWGGGHRSVLPLPP